MQIWVDADACPKVVRDILLRASFRRKIKIIFVANQPMSIATTALVRKIIAPAGFDAADNEIINNVHKNDLVITADIPLADAVIERGCLAINPRGELYSKENIKSRLNLRDFHDALRSSGVNTRGPDKLSPKDIQNFANQLDRLLEKFQDQG